MLNYFYLNYIALTIAMLGVGYMLILIFFGLVLHRIIWGFDQTQR